MKTENNKSSLVRTVDGHNYLVPFILVTSLFFIWGFANTALTQLNSFFQEQMNLSPTSTALIQTMVYGAYFLMAIPAGICIHKIGYKRTVMLGLGLFSLGAFLFYPSSLMGVFPMFLLSLFILGCGLTCLETSANPYATVLGSPETGTRRLNVAQSLNGLGCIGGPTIGLVLFSNSNSVAGENQLGSVALVYIIIGLVSLVALLVFSRCKLPEITQNVVDDVVGESDSLWSNRGFVFGLVALFAYVAAQTSLFTNFIDYMTMPREGHADGILTKENASLFLSFGGMGLFFVGRLVGSTLMKFFSGATLLAGFSIGATIGMAIISFCFGSLAIASMYACFFFASIMFPTIFAIAIEKVGVANTHKASSYLVMCIVGGAVSPYVMAQIYEQSGSIDLPYIVPCICFAIISAYALFMRR